MNGRDAVAAAAKEDAGFVGAVMAGRDQSGRWPIGAIARRLPADAHAIAPEVLAVPAGFVEDVRLRRLACRALALQPAALPRSFVQPMREQ